MAQPSTLPPHYSDLVEYPALIEGANLDVDQAWQDFYAAQEAEDKCHRELLKLPEEGFNVMQRKQWRDALLAGDAEHQALRRLRILSKTMVNEAKFKRERLHDEFRVARLNFAAKHEIKEI